MADPIALTTDIGTWVAVTLALLAFIGIVSPLAPARVAK
jgi:hypothetical protein